MGLAAVEMKNRVDCESLQHEAQNSHMSLDQFSQYLRSVAETVRHLPSHDEAQACGGNGGGGPCGGAGKRERER